MEPNHKNSRIFAAVFFVMYITLLRNHSMYKARHLPFLFITGYSMLCLALFLLDLRGSGNNYLLLMGLTGMILSISFCVLCWMEISASTRLSKAEKNRWKIGLLIMPTLAGVLYMIKGRANAID